MKTKLVALATTAALFSGASLAADDKLTIGISQYPSTPVSYTHLTLPTNREV